MATRMAVYGHIGAFEADVECFTDYTERFDAFLEANAVPTDKKANLFLATVGPGVYKLLKNLCDPSLPSGKTYPELKSILQLHYDPEPIVIAERHKFWSASQCADEPVAEFVVRLKRLSSTCKFGAFLEEALRDRLVSGLHSRLSRIQTQLLAVRDLTFAVAKSKCLAEEMASLANKDYMGEEVNTNKLYQERAVSLSRKVPCKCCGGFNHWPANCKFRNATCHACYQRGHIRPACPANRRKPSNTIPGFRGRNARGGLHLVSTDAECTPGGGADPASVLSGGVTEPCQEDEAEMFGVYNIGTTHGKVQPYQVQVNVGGNVITMEVDTGASRSTVGERIYTELLSDFPLVKGNVSLYSYSKTLVPILGCIKVPVTYRQNAEHLLELVVVQGDRPALFGRDWMNHIQIDWGHLMMCNLVKEGFNPKINIPYSETYPPRFNELLRKNELLFSTENTGIKKLTASIHLKPNVKPVFQKNRPVPYSMVTKVSQEYDRLIKADILYPMTNSEWASPTVHVVKPQGSIRVCGDYKVVNEYIRDDGYKLPNIQEVFAMIAEGGCQPKVYSVLDLAGAFNQLYLDEESAKILVLNTCKGLLGSKRLSYGVKTAPAQFQAVMDKILTGIKGVFCYIDDILLATNTIEEHMKVIKEVFARLSEYNVRINGNKCLFFRDQVQYLGHALSAEGIRPLQDKIQAIREAPRPQNVSELKSLLGMINFYGKFLPNLASKLHPLYELLNHSTVWNWTSKCEDAFEYVKYILTGDHVLMHYDSSKPLVLNVDASPYGLGAVLSHKLKDGTEKPIAFASRTLSKAEKNYAHIEKEALAIIFGVKKFHLYLYGNKFLLATDHRPLTHIFGPKNGIPSLAAARMQRWALILAGYEYVIVYRPSTENLNADLLSRLPIPNCTDVDPDENYVCYTGVHDLPITAKNVADSTNTDILLVKVYEYTASGWPNYTDDDDLRPFWNKRQELTIEDDCLLWGRRVIVPSKLQNLVLSELHECHPGMCRMKALARSFVWWPGIDQDIEDTVRSCEMCINMKDVPKVAPLILWPWATEPWQRIHIDYAEISGQHFLVIVDSHSKWMEVFPVNSLTTLTAMNILKGLFARYGFPQEVVSDNGPQFIAEDFKYFLKINVIKHTLCPPYHPSSNGLAEKHVQTFKRMFLKYEGSQQIPHKLADILFRYRNLPHTTTGKTPAELFLKRVPRTRLSLIKPCLKSKIEQKQAAAKLSKDGSFPRFRYFDVFQKVRVRNVRGGREKWIPGIIVERKGPLTYLVRVPGNDRRFVHVDHLIPDDTNVDKPSVCDVGAGLPPIPDIINGENDSERLNRPVQGIPSLGDESSTEQVIPDDNPNSLVPTIAQGTTTPVASPGASISRYGRVRRPPRRFDLYLA